MNRLSLLLPLLAAAACQPSAREIAPGGPAYSSDAPPMDAGSVAVGAVPDAGVRPQPQPVASARDAGPPIVFDHDASPPIFLRLPEPTATLPTGA